MPSGQFSPLFLDDIGSRSATSGLPQIKTSTVIGITVAIAGNVLISLALNLQKMAHRRLESDKFAQSKGGLLNRMKPGNRNGVPNGHPSREGNPSLNETDEDLERMGSGDSRDYSPRNELPAGTSVALVETQRLLDTPRGELSSTTYGIREDGSSARNTALRFTKARKQRRPLFSRVFAVTPEPTVKTVIPVDVIAEDAAITGPAKPQKHDEPNVNEESNESDYLKSKLWWLGFLLMNVGELGNFISYAFAPASIVAPLGTFALMANCVFAPIMLHERFRNRDLLGILIAIIGAVTVVLSSNASDTRLDPKALVRAISQRPFIVYSIVYVIGAIALSILSQGKIGRQWVFVDVGLCALFGGFTVLSTKAVSTLLTMEWIDMFTEWITYPTIAVLILTGVCQIRYLNRALMRFDSKVVIPIQFVLFNLSAIVGSAIMYGDFKTATFHQMVTFLYGCAATFGGVFIIAWAPNSAGTDDDEDDELGDAENEIGSPDGAFVGVGVDEGSRLGMGTIGRRRHTALVLPTGVRESPTLRHKRSTISLSMGLSPAQHLLLVHTPPREMPEMRRERNWDLEREPGTPTDSPRRRRALSWFSDDGQSGGTRDSSIFGKLRNGTDGGSRVGSLDGQNRL